MVLDVMLPEIDGFEVLKRVRAEGDMPVIMLTARDDDIDQIIGLEIGADDYMTKPFNPRVLVAQVKAVLRRSSADSPTADSLREVGNLSMNPAARTTRVDGKLVELRAKEFDLLLTLIDNANRVLSRDQLLDLVWGYDYYGQTRTVDVHVAHLRDKLAESSVVIETVWGKGYKLVI
jgi:DNA-binding response OmpR family regulator